MSNILITGASGFIGHHLQKIFDSNNLSLIDLMAHDKTASCFRARLSKNIQKVSILENFVDISGSKPEIVIHLAAETGISDSLHIPEKYFETNVKGTFNVLEQCRKNRVKYLIYASSSSVYAPGQKIMTEDADVSNQLSFYGTSKRMTEVMIENYCKQFGLVAIGLRFFTVYGSWTRPDMAAYKFMQKIETGEKVILYNDGNVYRDFTHVSDIIKSIKLLTENIKKELPGTHKIFNIGSRNPVSVRKYASLIAQNLDKELLWESKPLPANELESTHSDTTLLKNYIAFEPKCNLEEGIKEMTDWFKNFRYE